MASAEKSSSGVDGQGAAKEGDPVAKAPNRDLGEAQMFIKNDLGGGRRVVNFRDVNIFGRTRAIA